jgi:hypothetical protein
MSFFKASLGASAVADQHHHLWSDSSRDNDNTSGEVETPIVCSDLCTLGKSLSREAFFRSGCYLRALQEVEAAQSCVR